MSINKDLQIFLETLTGKKVLDINKILDQAKTNKHNIKFL